jgi:hypothetical protein
MRLADFMQKNSLNDAAMAELVGNGCSESSIRKLRLEHARPSLKRAWRIEQVTDGKVGLSDWQYLPRRYQRSDMQGVA